MDDTEVGNDGEGERGLYQMRTKSRTIMMRILESAAETEGADGQSGGRECGEGLDDH